MAGDNYVYVAGYTTGAWEGNLEAKTIDLNSGVLPKPRAEVGIAVLGAGYVFAIDWHAVAVIYRSSATRPMGDDRLVHATDWKWPHSAADRLRIIGGYRAPCGRSIAGQDVPHAAKAVDPESPPIVLIKAIVFFVPRPEGSFERHAKTSI
jgi:hypothetical protein